MRRIGETWRPGVGYRDRPGAYAIAMRGGRLLAVWQEGRELQLPGGGIDPGEQPLAALHREVMEETGWRIAGPGGGPPVRIAGFQRYAWLWDYRYWARKVQTVYLARAVMPLGPPTEPDHRPVWLGPAEAAERLHVAGDREAVRLALARGLIGP
jgi:8-oxo-dGTP diphosphatase